MAVQYAYSHFVFRAIGHFGDTGTDVKDHWSTGFRLGHANAEVPLSSDLSAFLAAMETPMASFHTSVSVKSSQTCWLSEMTIARVGTDGKYNPSTQQTVRRPYTPPIRGSSGLQHPFNTALVLSLRTPFPRGIASNGRTYYPALAMPLNQSTGRVDSSVLTAFNTAAKTLVTALNTAAATQLGSGVSVIVAGQSGKTGPARNGTVTSIRIDDRLDSIERRENDLVPVYSTVTIP